MLCLVVRCWFVVFRLLVVCCSLSVRCLCDVLFVFGCSWFCLAFVCCLFVRCCSCLCVVACCSLCVRWLLFDRCLILLDGCLLFVQCDLLFARYRLLLVCLAFVAFVLFVRCLVGYLVGICDSILFIDVRRLLFVR